jgi:hypothetical protein
MGKCYNSIVVNKSIENVWETISNFHRLSWGDAVVTSVDAVADFCNPIYSGLLGSLASKF